MWLERTLSKARKNKLNVNIYKILQNHVKIDLKKVRKILHLVSNNHNRSCLGVKMKSPKKRHLRGIWSNHMHKSHIDLSSNCFKNRN